MKISKVTLNYGLTKSTDKFESLRVDMGVELTVDEGDNLNELIPQVRQQLQTNIEEYAASEVERIKLIGFDTEGNRE